MNNTSIHVQIYKSVKCIYEKNNSVDASNLNHLISCLNATQIEINDFLTSLVEKQDSSIDTGSKWKKSIRIKNFLVESL